MLDSPERWDGSEEGREALGSPLLLLDGAGARAGVDLEGDVERRRVGLPEFLGEAPPEPADVVNENLLEKIEEEIFIKNTYGSISKMEWDCGFYLRQKHNRVRV